MGRDWPAEAASLVVVVGACILAGIGAGIPTGQEPDAFAGGRHTRHLKAGADDHSENR